MILKSNAPNPNDNKKKKNPQGISIFYGGPAKIDVFGRDFEKTDLDIPSKDLVGFLTV